jgi:hypothetical protein
VRAGLPTWDAAVDSTLALYEAAMLGRPRPVRPRADAARLTRRLPAWRGTELT